MYQPRDLLRLSYVPRWTIVPMNRSQSVADHSFRVASIVMQICGRLATRYGAALSHEVDATSLVMAALWHDISECLTGDIPSPAKIHLTQSTQAAMYSPSPGIGADILKIADTLEAQTWHHLWGNGAHFRRYEAVQAYLGKKLEAELDSTTQYSKDLREIVGDVHMEIVGGQ